jgi:hypothetical protein
MTEIVDKETMWYPGPDYIGRHGPYAQHASDITREELIRLVQERTMEDGEWVIAHGLVGENEELMRKRMEWVCRSRNILQCYEHAVALHEEHPTVDWICRELVNVVNLIGTPRGR